MKEYSEKWKALRIALLGGDEREREIARLAASTGATVTAYGFPWPDAGIAGVIHADTAEHCLQAADICLMPIPGIAVDGSIFADEKIIPRAELLSLMAPAGHVILGKADEGLRAAAAELGISVHEYEHDQELMLLRTPAIVEAALRIIIENTDVTIHKAAVCVVGQGNIGTALTRSLIALGARVTVAARNPAQRAAAWTMGAEGLTPEDLPEAARRFDMLLTTVPAPIVTSGIIDRLPATALVMDLSAPPGGADLGHARHTGRKAIWARALGRRAPVTVGGSQWHGIAKIIRRTLAGETA